MLAMLAGLCILDDVSHAPFTTSSALLCMRVCTPLLFLIYPGVFVCLAPSTLHGSIRKRGVVVWAFAVFGFGNHHTPHE
jgi:hypothetical protein